jgi:hypothetical protein
MQTATIMPQAARGRATKKDFFVSYPADSWYNRARTRKGAGSYKLVIRERPTRGESLAYVQGEILKAKEVISYYDFVTPRFFTA